MKNMKPISPTINIDKTLLSSRTNSNLHCITKNDVNGENEEHVVVQLISWNADPIFVCSDYYYVPKKRNELHLKDGDLIRVVKKRSDGWWEGFTADQCGWFPCSIVHEIQPSYKLAVDMMNPKAKWWDITFEQLKELRESTYMLNDIRIPYLFPDPLPSIYAAGHGNGNHVKNKSNPALTTSHRNGNMKSTNKDSWRKLEVSAWIQQEKMYLDALNELIAKYYVPLSKNTKIITYSQHQELGTVLDLESLIDLQEEIIHDLIKESRVNKTLSTFARVVNNKLDLIEESYLLYCSQLDEVREVLRSLDESQIEFIAMNMGISFKVDHNTQKSESIDSSLNSNLNGKEDMGEEKKGREVRRLNAVDQISRRLRLPWRHLKYWIDTFEVIFKHSLKTDSDYYSMQNTMSNDISILDPLTQQETQKRLITLKRDIRVMAKKNHFRNYRDAFVKKVEGWKSTNPSFDCYGDLLYYNEAVIVSKKKRLILVFEKLMVIAKMNSKCIHIKKTIELDASVIESIEEECILAKLENFAKEDTSKEENEEKPDLKDKTKRHKVNVNNENNSMSDSIKDLESHHKSQLVDHDLRIKIKILNSDKSQKKPLVLHLESRKHLKALSYHLKKQVAQNNFFLGRTGDEEKPISKRPSRLKRFRYWLFRTGDQQRQDSKVGQLDNDTKMVDIKTEKNRKNRLTWSSILSGASMGTSGSKKSWKSSRTKHETSYSYLVDILKKSSSSYDSMIVGTQNVAYTVDDTKMNLGEERFNGQLAIIDEDYRLKFAYASSFEERLSSTMSDSDVPRSISPLKGTTIGPEASEEEVEEYEKDIDVDENDNDNDKENRLNHIPESKSFNHHLGEMVIVEETSEEEVQIDEHKKRKVSPEAKRSAYEDLSSVLVDIDSTKSLSRSIIFAKEESNLFYPSPRDLPSAPPSPAKSSSILGSTANSRHSSFTSPIRKAKSTLQMKPRKQILQHKFSEANDEQALPRPPTFYHSVSRIEGLSKHSVHFHNQQQHYHHQRTTSSSSTVPQSSPSLSTEQNTLPYLSSSLHPSTSSSPVIELHREIIQLRQEILQLKSHLLSHF